MLNILYNVYMETIALTRSELYDTIRTLEIMRKVEEQSKVYNDNNTLWDLIDFLEEVA